MVADLVREDALQKRPDTQPRGQRKIEGHLGREAEPGEGRLLRVGRELGVVQLDSPERLIALPGNALLGG